MVKQALRRNALHVLLIQRIPPSACAASRLNLPAIRYNPLWEKDVQVVAKGLFLSYQQGEANKNPDTLVLQLPETKTNPETHETKPKIVKVHGTIRIDRKKIENLDMVRVEKGGSLIPSNQCLVIHDDFVV